MAGHYEWFRFYHRMYRSPEVATLTDSEFRLLVSLWCMASAGDADNRKAGIVTQSTERIRLLAMPIHTVPEVEEMLATLASRDYGLIARDADGIHITRWDKHQYTSPSQTPEALAEKSRRARERKKLEAGQSALPRIGNETGNADGVNGGDEYPTDTETETEEETEQKQTRTAPAQKTTAVNIADFEQWWAVVLRHPTIKRCGKGTARTAWENAHAKRRLPPLERMIAVLETQIVSHDWTKEECQYAPMASTYLNQGRWDAELTPPEKAPVPLRAWKPQAEINNVKQKKVVY